MDIKLSQMVISLSLSLFLSVCVSNLSILTTCTVPITRKARRALILVGKVLQTISNGGSFGNKVMLPLNNLVSEYKTIVAAFFDALAVRIYLLLPPPLMSFSHVALHFSLTFSRATSTNPKEMSHSLIPQRKNIWIVSNF